jgi:hypothetical protein
VTSADEVGRAVLRLADQVTHWTPSRWAASVASGTPGDGTRADAGHALAQRLADLEAGVTGRPARPVPRLPNDLALPDQWRVLIRDLLDAGPDETVLAEVDQAVKRVRAELFS